MPDETILRRETPTVRSRLAADLRALGVRPGGVLMVHARVSALGWVVGGTGTVVLALRDTLGPDGTLLAYAGWEDDPSDMASWPAAWRDAYAAELPPFDPATAEAVHANGRLPERIRTWPGAHRSRHPEAGMVALGPRAAWLTDDHPRDDPYGAGSPLAKLVEADGQVLALGAPLDTLTLLHHAEATAEAPAKRRVAYRMPLLHHAEATAEAPAKRRVAYRMPLLEEGRTVWREFRDIDTATGAFPYEEIADEIVTTPGVESADEAFAAIARQALAAGIGRAGRVGAGESFLFPAAELHRFAEAWLEARFGGSPRGGSAEIG